MGHCKSLIPSLISKTFVWLISVHLMVMMIMLGRVTSEDPVPATGSLCISDCATCPLICPPPPPSQPVHHSPPSSYRPHPPPGSLLPSPPPPAPTLSPPPPAPTLSPPPYFSWGIIPPSPLIYFTAPIGLAPPMVGPRGLAPPMVGPHDYSYPYYYFYASKGSSLSLAVSPLLVLFSFHFVLFCGGWVVNGGV